MHVLATRPLPKTHIEGAQEDHDCANTDRAPVRKGDCKGLCAPLPVQEHAIFCQAIRYAHGSSTHMLTRPDVQAVLAPVTAAMSAYVTATREEAPAPVQWTGSGSGQL